MNMKQKMVEAMEDAYYSGCSMDELLDAALSVAADPENWSNYKNDLTVRDFVSRVNHIKGLPS